MTAPRRWLALLIAAAVLTTACVRQATLTDDCGAVAVERHATLSGDHLDPQSIGVCKGQQVTLSITTQRAGEIHLHGYDREAPEVPVEPGDTATFKFHATRPGQFIIELHTPNEGPEIQVGVLTVNEP